MRLFVAVRPPAQVLDVFAALPRPAVDGLRWTGPDQWHVTLRFLGEVDDPGPVTDALAGLPVQACTAVLCPRLGRFGRRVLHVPVDGLAEVAAAVVVATRALGRPPDERPFAGHVTLARARGRDGVDLRSLCRDRLGREQVVAARWTVDRLSVFESRLHPDGARYTEVASVGLYH